MGLVVLFAAAALFLAVLATAGLLHRLAHPPRVTLGAALARGLPADPAELGLSFEERSLRLFDSTTTRAWLIEGRRPDGPVIVVTHGWADSRFGAQRRATLLVEFASLVVCYDLRGHGYASAPASDCGSPREGDDLLAIVQQLEALHPTHRGLAQTHKRRYVLFGYSMGANISLIAAARDRDGQIAGVIADGPYRRWHEPIVGLFRLRRWPAYPLVWIADAWLMLARPAFRREFDRTRWAARLRCPLLVLHGDADPLCPLASARAIAEAAPGHELVVFPGGGHLDLADLDPDRYRNAIARFIERVSAQ